MDNLPSTERREASSERPAGCFSMEQNREFERRAYSAAGPVFFAALGLMLLLVLAVLVLVAPVDALVGWLLGIGGLGSLALAFGWAALQRGERPRHS